MTSPLVSICLPNLNNRPFLEERIDTILAQDYPNWELVIVDYQSNDGAWEYFQQLEDPRIRLEQAPPKGLYANWNHCIGLAKGEYVYIATSDDTMHPNCIRRMVEALEANPDCAIADSNLTVIDEEGEEVPGFYAEKCRIAQYLGDWIHRPHIRRAPHDGLLHYLGTTVYISITQLLIRRSLFETVGGFRNDIGMTADFEWGMRASLFTNTFHIPEYLATWRVHQSQVTKFETIESAPSKWQLLTMTRLARQSIQKITGKDPAENNTRGWEKVFVMNAMNADLAQKKSLFGKLLCATGYLIRHPADTLHYVGLKIRKIPFDPVSYITDRFRKHGLNQLCEPGNLPESNN